MKYFFFLLLLVQGAWVAAANDLDIRYEDWVYKENIRSVKFHVDGLPVSVPMINLDAPASLRLSFDDMDADVKLYTYSFVHCDRDWKPSSLSPLEYTEGYADATIDENSFSFQSITHYTHYELLLPNRDMVWTKSGNYLLVVYEDGAERVPVITRRFMVMEQRIKINATMVRPNQVSKIRTHQEIDFEVDYTKFPMRNPQQEVRAAVLQNGRWDNAVIDLPPNFTRLNAAVFDYQDRVVFPGGKEFRFLDLRTLRTRPMNLEALEEYPDGYRVVVAKRGPLANEPYLTFNDLNGNFIVENFDRPNGDLSANYVETLFQLAVTEPYFDYDVYLFGALTDWRIQEQYRMVYNPATNCYVGKAFLKQGYYNYAFAATPSKRVKNKAPQADMGLVEGDWYEAENAYTVIIYYRPFGGRYDQIIGAASFSSN